LTIGKKPIEYTHSPTPSPILAKSVIIDKMSIKNIINSEQIQDIKKIQEQSNVQIQEEKVQKQGNVQEQDNIQMQEEQIQERINVRGNVEQGQSQELTNLVEQIRRYNDFVRQSNSSSNLNMRQEQNEEDSQSNNKRTYTDNLEQKENKKKR
jgi:hypothetical protein